MEKLFILILLGTNRPGRESEKAAKLITQIGSEMENLDVFLVDPRNYSFKYDGNDLICKDPRYSKLTSKADGFFIVTPEYNHSFPASLKRMLDTELQNYIHKPVSFAGVSNGIFGGARAIENLLPTVREMGMVATFSDVYFPQIQNLFDENEKIKDQGYLKRIKRAYEELEWMAKVLKWGRENLNSPYNTKK